MHQLLLLCFLAAQAVEPSLVQGSLAACRCAVLSYGHPVRRQNAIQAPRPATLTASMTARVQHVFQNSDLKP
jgi:hypothetical protein